MIVFAFDHKNRCISVVDARDKQLAETYWQGAGITPHTMRTHAELKKEKGYTFEDEKVLVVPIMKTRVNKNIGGSEDTIIVLPA